jgi:hypothetical protein
VIGFSSGGQRFAVDERASSRGAKAAVGLVIVLGFVALYAAAGGPLPFVAEGGPALDSVPGEADVVVYTDAWTFSSDTSRGVVDGIFTVSNESLPGYTGPTSLSSAFESLDDTSLDPRRLRSVTAFGSYDESGHVGSYQGLILKTTWSRSDIMSAFGDGRDAYERRDHEGTAVFVQRMNASALPAVAQLERDRYVVGTEQAVRDAIDAHTSRDSGMNGTLRSRFDDLDRAPVRFVAVMPRVPDQQFVPTDLVRTIRGIETVGGVYYPDGEHATVRLTVGTVDGANATALQPMLRDAMAAARPYVPVGTRTLIEDATVSRSANAVTVSMTGPVENFLGGYRAIIETGLLNFLTSTPVGEPALELVPGDVDAVGYADAGLVTDPTAQALFQRLLTTDDPANETTVDRLYRGLETVSVADLTSFRSATVFGQHVETNDTEAAAIVQANWSSAGVRSALAAANASYREEIYRGQRVFVVTEEAEPVWIASVSQRRQVVGTEGAVRAVIEVSQGDQQAVSGPLANAIENGTNYLRIASIVPQAATDAAGPFSDVVADVEVIGASYDTEGDRVVGQVDLHFRSESQASDAADVIRAVLALGGGTIDDAELRRLLESATVRQEGRVVTLTARTDPETLLGLVERMAATADLQADDGLTTLLPGDVSSWSEQS